MHKKTVTRTDLITALQAVTPGLAAKGENVEQSTCFVFSEGRVWAYNEEILCSSPCDLIDTGAIPAEPLIRLLERLGDEQLEVWVDGEEFCLKGKRKTAGIRFDKEVKLPIDQVKLPAKWSKLPDGFSDAIDMVKDCCSNNDLFFALRCVHVTDSFVEACDNVQGCRVECKTGVKTGTLIRYESAVHLVGSGVVKFGETSNWIHFRTAEDRVISCRRYMDEYPDLSKVFSAKGTAITLPKGLPAAVTRASTFTAEGSNSVVARDLVQINLEHGKLHIVGEGANGWYKEVEKLEYAGPDLKFSISPHMLSVIFKRTSSASITDKRISIAGDGWRMAFSLFQKDETKKPTKNAESDEGEE